MVLEKSEANIEVKTNVNLIDKIKQLEGVNHMIAHNLRGAGANIQMLAEILAHKETPDGKFVDSEEEIFTAVEAVGYIQESCTALLGTLNTLLQVAEIELEKDLQYDMCSVRDIVAGIICQLRCLIRQKNATIEFNLQIPAISYPKPYLESILYNLINNALKYSKPDVPLQLVISTYMEGDRSVLSVKDNGIGIDLEKFGKRMFKLNQVCHSGKESKGIGLFITKSQIESLGGEIAVKSMPNNGCEFIVTF